ncbi:MAG: hypothetical protein RQ728_09655 [Brevefilum sp.]|nr:hypothetical protein [Brevefilum sp.]MDT8382500.1 hypothetical protein [Brevefilum sp.]
MNTRRSTRRRESYFAVSINFTQNCLACLQDEVVFPFENNQGKEAYAIFGDAAAMFRHGFKKCCVGCPEKLRASIDKIILPEISKFVGEFFYF